ncbi:MAG: hypothetical protein JWL97_1423 [Gemmatimonadales bacterium]|nr:hypothetical protein [Gemmatimonadales bacterium]
MSSIHEFKTRHLSLLIAVSAGIAVAACNSDSPVEPVEPFSSGSTLSRSAAGITATAVSPSEIDLSWAMSPSATGYQVFRSDNGPTGNYSLIASTAANVTSYANSGLSGSTQYCYEIRSFKTAGKNTTYSAYSAAVCATTKPSPTFPAPTAADATPQGSTAVVVAWASDAPTVSGFRIERSAATAGPWVAAATKDASARSYLDARRQSEIAVCYHVIALYTGGESSPSNADCTTPPAGPTNLVAAPAPDAVTLTWKDNSGVEDQYEVQRSVDGVTFSTLISLPANTVTLRDAGVVATKTYWYRIQARKDGGTSDNSNTISATVPSPEIPNAPSGTEAVPVNSSSVRVHWIDNSTNESGFRIERASVAAGPWTEAATTAANVTSLYQDAIREQQVCFRVIALSATGASTPTPADCTTPPWFPTSLVARADGQGIALTWFDNSATEDGYKVSRLDAAGAWVDIATLPANAIRYRDVGVTLGVTYTYRVQALKDGGFSDFSNESAASIPPATGPPTAPFGVSASYYTDTDYGWVYFGATWADMSNNEDGFRVEYSDDGMSGWQVYTYVAANATSFYVRYSLFDVVGVSLAGCYRVIAFNGAGESDASNVTCTEWNNRPTSVTATALDQQSIDLSWTDNGRFEIGYVVFRSTTVDGIYDVIAETPPNATSYHDTGLATGQEYWYFIASDFGGYSSNDPYNYSEFVSATTLSATASAGLSGLSSPAVINRLSAVVRIRSRPTLQEIRARYRAAPRPTAILRGVTPIPFKGRARQKSRIR